MSWNKSNTVFIQASTGFLYEGSKAEGYQAYHPYRGNSIVMRILREICFRFTFLPKKIWYNKEFLRKKVEYFVVWDPLITKEYLLWLRKCFPNAQINFKYANMVGKTKHLYPGQIPDDVRVWTYDSYDSEKYNINLYSESMYFTTYLKPLKQPKYDVLFVGRDKGRGEWLNDLEQKLNKLGLRTKFIITADGRLSKKKSYYQAQIPYSEIVEYLTESRAVLNVTMENQRGITLRDMESVFLGIKLITTNEHIVDFSLYKKDNVFILGKNNIDELPDFLNSPVVPVDKKLLNKHTIAGMLDVVTA